LLGLDVGYFPVRSRFRSSSIGALIVDRQSLAITWLRHAASRPGCSVARRPWGRRAVSVFATSDQARLPRDETRAPAASSIGALAQHAFGLVEPLEGGGNTLRLAYSGVTADRIDGGIARLAGAYRSISGAPAPA